MADYQSRDVNVSFKGLTTTVAIFGVIGSICLIGFETLRQLRRLPKVGFVPFWKHDRVKRQGGRGGVDGDKNDQGPGAGVGIRGKLTCEDWEMGHLYLARMFHASTPSPPMARWPLAWTWQALRFNDWFYATHTGMDTVVYVRFLRALVWYLTLQTFTTAPILLAVHFKFSKGAALTDMTRASLSYLVTIQTGDCSKPTSSECKHGPNPEGRRLLWIHLCLLWYISITWCYALWWIGNGSLKIRRRLIEEIRQKRQKAHEEARQAKADAAAPLGEVGETMAQAQGLRQAATFAPATGPRGDDSDGWRQRTLLVTNLPPTMRDEASIRRYFEEFLRPDDGTPSSSVDDLNETVRNDGPRLDEEGEQGQDGPQRAQIEKDGNGESVAFSSSDTDVATMSPVSPVKTSGDDGGLDQATQSGGQAGFGGGPQPDLNPERHLRSPVQTVVLVRKMNELSSMLSRRQEVLNQLEAAHIKLAQNVLTRVGKQTTKMRKEEKRKRGFAGMGGVGMGKLDMNLSRIGGLKRKKKTAQEQAKGDEHTEAGDVEKDAAVQLSEERLRLNDLAHRLARFSPSNKGHHQREAQMRGVSEDGDEANVMTETVWEALAEVPRDLLDSFQPVTRLSSLFRGQTVPTIDYLLTKLNLLTALVTEMRARPPSSYEPTSTAFVTFRDPRQARMVWRELKSQIVVKVRLAPEVKDLDWERLMRTSFTGDLVRGLGVNSFFWAFTIFWVIPVGFLSTGLFSVNNIKQLVPGLAAFFDHNPTFEGFVSVTLPTVIVSVLTAETKHDPYSHEIES
ncbi:hypothetical protein L7F22_044586 [Adiantum nelumboides]|nr:hypothetical protein [Adiantum nelumboides]